jgi:hypothetical protein
MLVIVVIVGLSAIWVAADASRREWLKEEKKHGRLAAPASPVGWAFGTLALWIVVFPLYLARRRKALLKQTGTAGATSPDVNALATKQCPDCAEIVLTEARVCKHCKYCFEEPASSEGDLRHAPLSREATMRP